MKQRLWQRLLAQVPHDPSLTVVDSFPLPVCQFARAYRCRRFRGQAAYGYAALARQTFYGFRCHLRLSWPGIISGLQLAAANLSEPAVAKALLAAALGTAVGDRNYWSPRLAQELRLAGVALLAPYRSARRDPFPRRSRLLSHIRYRIDTVFGQLVGRFRVKTVWARDLWHLCSRLLRKVLSHTIAVLLNIRLGNTPLHLERLLTP